MQMIGCTQKLLQKLPLVPDEEMEVPPEDCWHANLIRKTVPGLAENGAWSCMAHRG